LHLDKAVELRRYQNRLQLIVKSVSRKAGHLRPGHQHLGLPLPLPSKCHYAVTLSSPRGQRIKSWPILSTGCYAVLGILIEGAVQTLAQQIPPEWQAQAKVELIALVHERLKAHGLSADPDGSPRE
jgi:hypothetical protein